VPEAPAAAGSSSPVCGGALAPPLNDVNQAEFTTALKSKMTNIYDEGVRKADPLKM
jgi:hypothetical protein